MNTEIRFLGDDGRKRHYYAGISHYGNCSYDSINGCAWSFYRFDSKEARDKWVKENDNIENSYTEAVTREKLISYFGKKWFSERFQ